MNIAVSLFTGWILITSTSIHAQDTPANALAQDVPMETVELPLMEVLGEREELALRMVKSALDRGRVYGYEGRDQLYCWYERGNGSHLIYLYCTQNKWMNSAARAASGLDSPRFRYYIYRSQFPVNPLQMERRLARLGPTAVNNEIVVRARHGEPMPDNVPSTEEVSRFAAALSEIKAIRSAGKNDPAIEAKMLSVIEENGLTVERYNHISKLVEQYSSLRQMVQDRL